MSSLRDILLGAIIAFWAGFLVLLAIEAGLFPVPWLQGAVLFRWQLWLLAGIVLVAVRDLLSTRIPHASAVRQDSTLSAMRAIDGPKC